MTVCNVTNENYVINITKAAKNRILDLLKHYANKNLKFRIYISAAGGCCSSFEYYFAFEEQTEEDFLIKDQELEVIIDPVSVTALHKATLDYIDQENCNDNLNASGFVITKANQKKGCGCDGYSCC